MNHVHPMEPDDVEPLRPGLDPDPAMIARVLRALPPPGALAREAGYNDYLRQVLELLTDKAEREEFVRSRIERGLASQIYGLRKAARLTQAELAAELGKPQSVISRLEGGRHGGHKLGTLLQIAARFDVALVVAFVPFGEVIERLLAERMFPLTVPPWKDDPAIHWPQ